MGRVAMPAALLVQVGVVSVVVVPVVVVVTSSSVGARMPVHSGGHRGGRRGGGTLSATRTRSLQLKFTHPSVTNPVIHLVIHLCTNKLKIKYAK